MTEPPTPEHRRDDMDIDMLRWWEAGESASAIADGLSTIYGEEITRNAVIGRIQRLYADERKADSAAAPLQRRLQNGRK